MSRTVLAVAALAAVTALAAPWGAGVRAQEGDVAPEIRITSSIGGDGRDRLADYRGEVVLLAFWGSH